MKKISKKVANIIEGYRNTKKSRKEWKGITFNDSTKLPTEGKTRTGTTETTIERTKYS
jgi:hypothetical protein